MPGGASLRPTSLEHILYMPRKPPLIERRLILAQDHRRKYGARLMFQVQRSAYIGDLENVTLLLPHGELATISPGRHYDWEGGKRYEIDIVGFPKASEAEEAGMQVAQALLVCAVSLNFGLRLSYISHEPPSVYDRTASSGMSMSCEMYSSWPQHLVLEEFERAFLAPPLSRRLLLSMELFAAAALESNDRARFVMAVSALEPLAEQVDLGPEVSAAIDTICQMLASDLAVPGHLRDSLRGRLMQLKRESVRQALKRLCGRWFQGDADAWAAIDRAYGLRSELLHEGRPSDLDTLLAHETQVVCNYLRRVYQFECGYPFKSPPAV